MIDMVVCLLIVFFFKELFINCYLGNHVLANYVTGLSTFSVTV